MAGKGVLAVARVTAAMASCGDGAARAERRWELTVRARAVAMGAMARREREGERQRGASEGERRRKGVQRPFR